MADEQAKQEQEAEKKCRNCEFWRRDAEATVEKFDFCRCGLITDKEMAYKRHCHECGLELWEVFKRCPKRSDGIFGLLFSTHLKHDKQLISILIRQCSDPKPAGAKYDCPRS